MTSPSVSSENTLLTLLVRVCILVRAVHASTDSESKLLARRRWEEEASDENKWQTFNDWSCNGPLFADDYPLGVSLATYISYTAVSETSVWGQPLPKANERILVFGAERPDNGSVHDDETWIYSPDINSWGKANSLERPPAREFYQLATLCDTNVILMGGLEMSGVWLHDVWLFNSYTDVWQEITVSNPQASPLRNILRGVAVQAADTDNTCECKESVFFFTRTTSHLQIFKLKCVDDGRVYEWVPANVTSTDVPNDCLIETISYNPATRSIHAMAREGLWRYLPVENVWQLVNDSVKATDDLSAIAVHFKNERGVMDRYVLFGNGVNSGDTIVSDYVISQGCWFREPVVGPVPSHFYTSSPPITAISGRLLAYIGTARPCNYLLWDLRPDWKNRAWTWGKIQTQRLSPSSITGPLTDVIGDRLYVLGGILDPSFYSRGVPYPSEKTDFWQLTINEMTWERLEPFPDSWNNGINAVSTIASGGILHGSVFLLCGEFNSAWPNERETRGYVFRNRVWLQYESETRPRPRKLHTMVAINESSLLMFGGVGGNHLALKQTWIVTLPEVNSSFVFWFQVTQSSSDVPNARYQHTIVRMDSGLIVLYGGLNNSGHCFSDIWHFNVTQKKWMPAFPTTRGPSVTRKDHCYATGSAIGGQVFFTVNCIPDSGDCVDSRAGLQVWMYSPDSNVWVFVSSSRPHDSKWSYSSFYWHKNLVIFDASKPQLIHTRLGCPPGYASPDILDSKFPCKACKVGYYSTAGATNCSKCPNGLVSEEKTSTSILNCSKCDDGQCEHGTCLVVQTERTPTPTCQCSFGYTGGRCQYPTYFLIGLGIVAFVLLLVIAVGIILKVRANKRRREAFLLHQVNELSNVWQISDAEIELFDRVGAGGYGEVFRAGYREFTVAVKVLRSPDDERINYEFEREIQFMQTIRHPNIVLFLGAGKFDVSGTPFIVVEYMENGSVRDLLDDDKREISPEQKVRFWADVARGMCFLHTLDPPRIHRDLKCSNLLIGSNGTVKVADFGLGRQVEHKRKWRQQRRSGMHSPLLAESCEMTVLDIGTARWRPPELSARNAYSTALDVYSYGIVLWEIWTRQLPFGEYRFDYQVDDAIRNGERPAIPGNCPRHYWQLMVDCWQHNSSLRPNFVVICQRVELLLSQFTST